MPRESTDVIIVGAGHNGLVAAIMLARAGLDVLVLERAEVLGGATRTERPFPKAPNMPTSTGAYLLGLMPPELMQILDLRIPTLRRDPHYFLPTTGSRYLLFGSDEEALKRQFIDFFSEKDWHAHRALQEELEAFRQDVGHTWLQEPCTIEDTAAAFVRPALRQAFVDLCRGSVGDYLERFDFESDLVKAMYAVTDGFSGLFGTWDTPGTGMNFLIHNMCRLPDAHGTWMIVEGGMGTVSRLLADKARDHGAKIRTEAPVAEILHTSGQATGVRLENGEEISAKTIVVNADPFRLRDLLGATSLPAQYNERIDSYRRPGSTFKLNLVLREMPRFLSLPDPPPRFGPTIHLLPEEEDVMSRIDEAFAEASRGELPEFPTIEWYVHSTVDPALTDEHGHLSSALFVQWVPYEPAGSTWEAEAEPYARHLLSIADRFAPGTSDRVVDMLPLHPQAIESRFGMTHGHIHHVDNAFGFSDRLPYATPIAGVYSCSAGTHPAGSVIGCGGHNCAQRVLSDLNLRG